MNNEACRFGTAKQTEQEKQRIRVAVFAQSKDQVSIDRQLTKCRDYAETNGMTIIDGYTEIYKAPRQFPSCELKRLANAAKHKKLDGILMTDLARITRKPDDFFAFYYDLYAKGIKIFTTIGGEFIPNETITTLFDGIKASVKQLHAQRIKAGKAATKAKKQTNDKEC